MHETPTTAEASKNENVRKNLGTNTFFRKGGSEEVTAASTGASHIV